MAKRKSKKTKPNYKKLVVDLVIVLVILAIVLAVYYVSNGYSFDFDFIKNNSSDSSSGEIETVDGVRDLTVTFIDIGQGDSILVEFPDGKNMLIDTGDNRTANKAVLDKYLTDENGNKIKIDYCVATHPDSDHIGLMPYIYSEYQIDNSYRPYVYSGYKDATTFSSEFNNGINIKNSTQIYYNYLKSVYDEGTYWEFFSDKSDFRVDFKNSNGDEFYYSVDFIMPYAYSLDGFQSFKNSNDFSAIIVIEYADKKIMLTGDIENETGKNSSENLFIKAFASNSAEVDCDVLKVAHHGSDSSTSNAFLSLVKPEYSVISCGLSNKHLHPLKQTLDNLTNCGSQIFRTDLQGTIVLTVDSSGNIKFGKQTDGYDKFLLDSGETLKQYEKDNNSEIANYKKTLG